MTGTDTDDERQGLLLGNEQSYQSTSCASLSSIAPLHDKRSRSEFTWVLIAIWSGVFLSALDGTIVAILATSIGSYFDEAHLASYIGTSYLLSSCCFTPLYGRASDILGRKTAFLVALTLFTCGTALCGIASSMKALIAARAIAGMGGGGVQAVATIATSDIIPLRERGLYHGYANILFATGAGLGGPLGGFINDSLGW
ncbi:hypothetical protein FRC03_011231 [Tulasnella sp. 419]|nr:hypothetical protein FRC03_011231 [Tulasnella sp. 419]